jgi:60 kDa SS-A/Ro ribonucleoprotein
MGNKDLFVQQLVTPTNTTNSAGGSAYDLGPKASLAQYISCGCFNDTFYTKAENQLAKILELCRRLPDEYVAKLAVFTHEQSFMKDTVAFLTAYLMTRNLDLFERVFNRVMHRGDQVRTFVQIVRSGVVGRRSFGTRPKRVVKNWINSRHVNNLFLDSVGNDPSLADVIRMVRPNPGEERSRNALYGYLTGNKYDSEALPELVRNYEDFKKNGGNVPNVRFEQLAGLDLSKDQWTQLALNSSWRTIRMNLNTFARHGVFADKAIVRQIADKLRDKALIQRDRAFPYQLLTAFQNVEAGIPQELTLALQDAMEVATENVPFLEGEVVVCPDISRSMHNPVTGARDGSTTKTKCIDVASLVAAAMLRNNNHARVIPFHENVVNVRLNPRDSVMTNAKILMGQAYGATRCAAPVRLLNEEKAKVDFLIFISDNESWINGTGGYGDRRQKGTELMLAWRELKKHNPNAKMVCIDIQPGGTTQALDDDSILNVGGFSDNVFKVITGFFNGNKNDWIDEIEKTEI